MISVNKEGRELVLRINLDQANPLIDECWNALQRSAGQPQLIKAAHAVLLRAVAQTLIDRGPDPMAAVRALDDDPTDEGQT